MLRGELCPYLRDRINATLKQSKIHFSQMTANNIADKRRLNPSIH